MFQLLKFGGSGKGRARRSATAGDRRRAQQLHKRPPTPAEHARRQRRTRRRARRRRPVASAVALPKIRRAHLPAQARCGYGRVAAGARAAFERLLLAQRAAHVAGVALRLLRDGEGEAIWRWRRRRLPHRLCCAGTGASAWCEQERERCHDKRQRSGCRREGSEKHGCAQRDAKSCAKKSTSGWICSIEEQAQGGGAVIDKEEHSRSVRCSQNLPPPPPPSSPSSNLAGYIRSTRIATVGDTRALGAKTVVAVPLRVKGYLRAEYLSAAARVRVCDRG